MGDAAYMMENYTLAQNMGQWDDYEDDMDFPDFTDDEMKLIMAPDLKYNNIHECQEYPPQDPSYYF